MNKISVIKKWFAVNDEIEIQQLNSVQNIYLTITIDKYNLFLICTNLLNDLLFFQTH